MHFRLWEFRFQSGKSQSELARVAGVSHGHISQIEAGESVPTVFVAKRLADALGVPLDRMIEPDVVEDVGRGS